MKATPNDTEYDFDRYIEKKVQDLLNEIKDPDILIGVCERVITLTKAIKRNITN